MKQCEKKDERETKMYKQYKTENNRNKKAMIKSKIEIIKIKNRKN